MPDLTDLVLGTDGVDDPREPTGGQSLEPVLDKARVAAEVMDHYTRWREHRRRHEPRWFVSGAFLRGQQHVEYNEGLARLVTPTVPTYRVQLDINRVRPKIRARLSKFFKNRPKPLVVPASTEYRDVLNARASEKILSYHWDRLGLEARYKQARLWAAVGAKAYWWFRWDATATARIRQTDPVTGQARDETVQVGDVEVEVGSPFEVLVADPAISAIGDQPAIQRIRMLDIEDVRQRYPEVAAELAIRKEGGQDQSQEISQYVDRLATLRSGDIGSTNRIERPQQLLVVEEFTAPCAKHPKGRYVVVIGGKVARYEDELPYEMYDHPANPYPVVEFADTQSPGQFWGTTYIEQLVDIQRQSNYILELITENARAVSRPKIIIYKQHNLAAGAWTNAAGEVVELTYVPGLPPPIILQPANVAGDLWNLLNYYKSLFDDLTQVFPAAEGKVAAATSGFQTNLLQEATDSVHAPDVRDDELALQEAAWKIRRLCRLGYTEARLFSVLGDNSLPEVLEFSQSQIDEYAEVRIQAGSMLPDLKAAKAQVAMELYRAGLFGNPQDPLVRRRVLGLLDGVGLDVVREDERRDADLADQENQRLASGQPVKPAQFIHDHDVHIERHQNYIKSPAFERLPPDRQQALIAHVITHWDWRNPAFAQGLRQQYGLVGLPIATPPPPPQPALGMGGPSLGGPAGPASPTAPPLGGSLNGAPQPAGMSPAGLAPRGPMAPPPAAVQ